MVFRGIIFLNPLMRLPFIFDTLNKFDIMKA